MRLARVAGYAVLQTYEKELTAIEGACRDIASSHKLTGTQRAKLEEQFGNRFRNALKLMEKGKVHRYRFKPSGRTIWTVKGRKGIYQVIPETNFCNCDDYYFRVMDGQRGLCYHIIAQKMASSLEEFKSSDLRDAQYSKITQRWRTRHEAST